MQTDKKFVFRFLVFFFILAGIYVAIFATILKTYYLDIIPTVFLYFASYTWASHKLLTEASLKRPVQFQNIFLGTVTLKIFVSLTLMLVYLFFNKENAKPFLAFTLINYFAFTIFEVSAILQFIKNNKTNTKK